MIASSFQGRRFNRPNDVVVKSDGAIYFTDPGGPAVPEQWDLTHTGVYRVSADLGTLTLLVSDFIVPNGLAFSPDESILYINDSRRGHIRAFDMLPNGTLARQTDLFGQPRSIHLPLPFHCVPPEGPQPEPSKEAQYYADVAASVQQVLEEAVFALAEAAKARTKAKRLSGAGGVAHNAVLIGKLVQSGLFEEVYLPPDPGDGGAAVGAALAAWM